MAEQQIVIGVATRPHPKEVVNGDSWAVDWSGTQCRLSVIDGLGHGSAAADASQAAREQLAAQPALDPVDALVVCHQALSRTRGVCMFVVSINPVAAKVSWAGVGNVETRLWQGNREQRLTNHRGIIGARIPSLRAFELELKAPWMLVMHSDGVSARFITAEILEVTDGSPQSFADTLLAMHPHQIDDATVLVAAADSPPAAE